MERLGDVLKRFTPKSTSGATEGTPDEAQQSSPAPSCSICGDTGWVRSNAPFGDPDFGKAVVCRCWQERSSARRMEGLLQYSNLRPLGHLTFESLDPQGRGPSPEDRKSFQEAYRASLAFADDPQGWLVLAGPSGCGKTHLAVAIGNRRLEAGHPALFIALPDLLDHLRSSYSAESESPLDVRLEQVREASLLILDDVGMATPTAWAAEKLFQVLNHRYNLRLPTVIVLAGPWESLGERLRTRLQDTKLSRVVELARRAPSLVCIGTALSTDQTFEAFDPRWHGPDPEVRQSMERALKHCREFARDPKGWLLLTGPHGSGKTHLAMAIVRQRAEAGQQAVATFVPALVDRLRSTFRPDSETSYDELFEQVKRSPLLLLDALGSELGTKWAREKLYQIIEYRYNAKLPTIITTTLLEEEFPEEISHRVFDMTLVNILPLALPEQRARTARPTRTRRSGAPPA